MSTELTREELLEVALLDVIAEGGSQSTADVLREAQEWLSDPGSWAPEVWPLLEVLPTTAEMQRRMAHLARLGMVVRQRGTVEITRAGHQMWDGFPWEYFAEDADDER